MLLVALGQFEYFRHSFLVPSADSVTLDTLIVGMVENDALPVGCRNSGELRVVVDKH